MRILCKEKNGDYKKWKEGRKYSTGRKGNPRVISKVENHGNRPDHSSRKHQTLALAKTNKALYTTLTWRTNNKIIEKKIDIVENNESRTCYFLPINTSYIFPFKMALVKWSAIANACRMAWQYPTFAILPGCVMQPKLFSSAVWQKHLKGKTQQSITIHPISGTGYILSCMTELRMCLE